MPRYFLHVRDGIELARDLGGAGYPNLDAAEYEAKKVIRELLEDWPSGWPEAGPDLVIAIEDHIGQRLATVPFSQTVDVV